MPPAGGAVAARSSRWRQWLALWLAAAVSLQVFFTARLALAAWLAPQSTALQRSEAWRLTRQHGPLALRDWAQQWRDYEHISDHLKRAVVAAEDDGFVHHVGVDWDAIQSAWQRNARLQARSAAAASDNARPIPLRGGSTITQQLAKNLLLSGERTLWRKGQELALTFAMEQLLDKRRILELYLNNVEWGEGIFGAEAAARHYFRKSAAQLNPAEAARLAVMLPAPRRFERNPHSAYLNARARSIASRMAAAQLP